MFGFKKKTERLTGKTELAASYIMAVPASTEAVYNTDDIVGRLKKSGHFQLVYNRLDARDNLEVAVSFRGEEYRITFLFESVDLPDLYTINHTFTEEGIAAMRSAKTGITSVMTFGPNPLDSYLLQIKVLCCAVPNPVGLIDISSERILSGTWARMAAASEVPPAPSYVYSIQAISDDENDGVWLHTHGLNRCGSVELEILNASKEYYQQEATVIQTIAGNVIMRGPLEEELKGFWVCNFPDDEMLVCTWLRWEEAISRFYPKLALGGRKDRADGHNTDTGVLLCYPDGKSYDKRRPAPIAVFDKRLAENPLLMITTEETDRMRTLAAERFSYFRTIFGTKDSHALIKFGMDVDEKHLEESGDIKTEHIWFEVLSLDEDAAVCKATQDAYYIDGIKEDTELTVPLSRLTDWTVYLPDNQITPDTVYLLE